jgi:isonocardicin synthase
MIERSELKGRPLSWIFEPFDRKPFDIFFLSYAGQRLMGRKLPAVLPGRNGVEELKCCLISANMFLGVVEREQITEHGVIVFYRPLNPTEKELLIKLVKDEPLTDLYYPYPVPKMEQNATEDYWSPTTERVQELDDGERMLREYTIEWLSRFDMKQMVVYDPACSTGTFLAGIKENFPLSLSIGQDLSLEMVKYCEGRVDQLYWGDSINPPTKEESVDFVFFRFLNATVVDTLRAHELFLANARCCRNGGYIVLFGHTPVILSSEWLEGLGLEFERKIGYSETLNSIFQYYILRKGRPLPEIALIPDRDFHALTWKR